MPEENFYEDEKPSRASASGRQFSTLRETHEELYGRCLALNEKLSEGDSFNGFSMLFTIGTLTMALAFGWYREVPGWEQKQFGDQWEAYVLLLVGGFLGFGAFGCWLEARKYASLREELISAVRYAGLSRPTLIARLEGDDGVAKLLSHIKTDSDFDRHL